MLYIIDFDETITPFDTVYELLKKFATEDWKIIEEQRELGEIDSPTCLSKKLKLINADQYELEEYFHNVTIDPMFVDFARYVSNFADIAIASDGLDYPIKYIMKKNGLSNIPIYANKIDFNSETINISFPNVVSQCSQKNGVCKCAIAKSYKDSTIILVGNSQSNYCLAKKANYVFAKEKLHHFCQHQSIANTPFTSFDDLMNKFFLL